jgi:dynein heavy chain
MKIIDELNANFEAEMEGLNNNQKFDFFLKNCRKQLRMVLCFSPVGEDFRRRLRNFPAFINNTTINFFLSWPESALEEVAFSHLEKKTFENHIKK